MDDHFCFASRTNWRQEPNALHQALEDLKTRRMPVLDLTASNPTTAGLTYPPGLLQALALPANLTYAPQDKGMLSARGVIGRRYHVDPQNIVLTASTSEAYSFLLRLLVNPGERVLIPRPSYPLFQFLLEINDVAFDYYPLVYGPTEPALGKAEELTTGDGHWHLDRGALEGMVDDKTKAIICVNPNNPTGSYIYKEELGFLNRLCRKRRLALISDEVFFDYAWGRGDWISCTGNQAVLTFVLGGLSKALALPQMKCAWILASGPRSLLKEAMARLEIIADTYLSVNTPAQNALADWFSLAPSVQGQIGERVSDNWQWLCGHCDTHAHVLAAQGGWYAIVRIPAVKSEEEWVLEFLEAEHVLAHPGYFFDLNQEAHIVLSLLPPAEIFREAVGRIMKRVARNLIR